MTMSPSAGNNPPGGVLGSHRPDDTDPGRSDPYALYRTSGGTGAQPRRPTPRPYEQALIRPEGTAQPGDEYSWLFREGTQLETSAQPEAPAETTTRRVAEPELRRDLDADESTEISGSRNRGRVILALVLAFAMVGGIVAGLIVSFRTGGAPGSSDAPRTVESTQPTAAEPTADSTPPDSTPTPDASTATATPYEGNVLPVTPVGATADCQAPPATDDAGNRVTYLPASLLDGNPSTAWRCNDDGVGHTITVELGGQAAVAEVGLINGYAKIDPKSGAHRYGEYRRIAAVTWSFLDGTSFQQTLSDNTEVVQTIRIPVQTATQLTLTINSSTPPGSAAATRDAVLISEITIAAPA
jgi:hypothetical protein